MSDTELEKNRRKRCRNWFRGAMALRYVRNGMQQFIEVQIHRHYQEIVNKLKSTQVSAASSCKSCTNDNLLPFHAIKRPCFRRHCFCNIQALNRRPCPLNLCDRLYDEIVNSHSLNSPLWVNTNPSKWFEDEWEIAKCFLGSQGYADKDSAKDTDLAGLISIAINNTFIQNNMDTSIEEVKEIRDIRNSVLHSASQELEDDEVVGYIGKMMAFLNDKKAFADNEDTEKAKTSLQQLRDDSMTLIEVLDLKEEGLKALKEREIFQNTRNINKNLEELLKRQEIDQKKKKEELLLFKKRIKEGIISFYKKSCSTTDISPFLPEMEVAVDKIYAPPLLVLREPSDGYYSVLCYYNLNQSKHKHGKIQSLEDFLRRENMSNRTVLLLGEAGVGKTSFCLNIISHWCKFQSTIDEKSSVVADQSFLNKDYVFFIQLKYCQDCVSIEEMIRKTLVDELYHNTLMDILQSESERCLVLLDGLENWTKQNTDCCRGQSECFPNRELKSQLTVIYTSRPWKLASVRPRSSEIDVNIELCGIVDSALGCFVDRVFKHLETSFGRKCPRRSTTCLGYMRHRNLCNLMNSPLFLKFVICLWFDWRLEDMSYSGIYTSIVETLLDKISPPVVDRATRTIPNYARDIVKRFPKAYTFLYSIVDYIFPLAVFAFNLCFKERKRYFHKYHDSELEAFGLDKTTFKDLQTIGILTERIVYTPSASRKCTEVSFIHDTFIEYFAAIHLSGTYAHFKVSLNR